MNTNSTSAAWLSRLLKAAAAVTMAASAVAFAPLAHAQTGTVSVGNCTTTNTAMTGFAWNGSTLTVNCGTVVVGPPPTIDPLAGTFRLSAASNTVNGGAVDTVYVERITGWLNAYTIAYTITATGNASATPSSGTVSFGDKDGASRPIAINTGTGGGTLTVTLGAVTPATTTAAGVYTLTVNGTTQPPPVGGGGDWKTDAATPQVACSTGANYSDFFRSNGQKAQFTLKGGESAAVAFIANGGTQPQLSTTETINTPAYAEHEIVVSQCPGDFSQPFPCEQHPATIAGGYVAGNSGVAQPPYMVGAYCQLTPGNKYYMNVRQTVKGTTTPSCPTATNPQGCEIRTQVQNLF